MKANIIDIIDNVQDHSRILCLDGDVTAEEAHELMVKHAANKVEMISGFYMLEQFLD